MELFQPQQVDIQPLQRGEAEMPHRTITKLRAIGARLVLNAMMECAKARNEPTNYENIMLRLAVVVGQAEGKPLTPTKVAQYLDLPRTTVLRRTANMVAQGELEQDPRSKVLRVPDEFLESAEATSACRRISQMINNAAAAMSKLDTQTIAERPGRRHSSYSTPASRGISRGPGDT